jgi:hypothetical protein
VSIVDTVFDVTVGSVAALPTTEDVAGSPNGNRAYVGRQWCEGEGCIWSVTVVDVATRTPITVVPTSGVPRHIEVGPFGDRVFVVGGSSTANTLDVIDGATNAVLHSQEIDVPLPTLGFPQPPIFDARIDPTGTAIYLTNTGGVAVLDTTTYEVTPATARGGDHLSFDPLGTRAYVAGCSGPPESPCGIVVVDTGTRAVVDVIPLDFRPIEAMLITPDGARGYVFGQFFENDAFISKVFSIDLQAAKASPTALRESDIWWLVLHPDTERFYSCESADGLTFVVKVLDVGNGGELKTLDVDCSGGLHLAAPTVPVPTTSTSTTTSTSSSTSSSSTTTSSTPPEAGTTTTTTSRPPAPRSTSTTSSSAPPTVDRPRPPSTSSSLPPPTTSTTIAGCLVRGPGCALVCAGDPSAIATEPSMCKRRRWPAAYDLAQQAVVALGGSARAGDGFAAARAIPVVRARLRSASRAIRRARQAGRLRRACVRALQENLAFWTDRLNEVERATQACSS